MTRRAKRSRHNEHGASPRRQEMAGRRARRPRHGPAYPRTRAPAMATAAEARPRLVFSYQCRQRRPERAALRNADQREQARVVACARRTRDVVRLDENRWPARMRERAQCGRRVAEQLGNWRPDGRDGQRSRTGRWYRPPERRREVLAECTIVGVDPGAFGPAMCLNVRRRIRTVACRLELRIGQRRGGWSDELDQRDGKRQKP